MSFFISLPVNDDRDRQVIYVPGYGRFRLTSKRHYPSDGMTFLYYEKDDDTPGDRIGLREEPYPMPIGGPDWTTLQVSDGPERFVWAEPEPARCEQPREEIHAVARC
jgi:hypothetical protein